jgi:hypothetical protein
VSVANGQIANEDTFNEAFVSRKEDSNTKGKIALENDDAGSGAYVANPQQAINETFDAVGMTGEGDATRNTYSSEQIIANGDDRKVAIGKLDAQVKTNLDDITTNTGNIATNTSNISTNTTNIGTNTSDISDINTSIGAANGIAPLDASAKVPTANLPDSVLGGLSYQGTWNANTNTPTLGNSGAGGSQGHYYVVSVAGTTSIDGISDWEIGDWVVHNGTVWEKVDNTDSVVSVNGQTGVVVLDKTDIGLSNVTDDAQLKRAAGDINTFTEKTTPVNDDIIIIEDSEDSNNKKKVKLANIGIGGGSGGVNFIENFDFENGTTGVSLFNDGVPWVDGTGGTNLVLTLDNTPAISGTGSLLIEDNTSGDPSGEGASIDFTTRGEVDHYGVMTVAFDYILTESIGDTVVTSLASGDIEIGIYDITNGAKIPLSTEILPLSGLTERFIATFQTTDSENYRLVFFFNTTDAELRLKIDNVEVGPRQENSSQVIQDLGSFTPVLNNFGTISSASGRAWRMGDKMVGQVEFTSGTTVGSLASMQVPFSQQLQSVLSGNTVGVGTYNLGLVNENNNGRMLANTNNSSSLIYFGESANHSAANRNPLNRALATDIAGNGLRLSISFEIPIAAWKDTQVVVDEYANRNIMATATLSSSYAGASSTNPIPFDTVTNDKVAMFESNGFRIKSSGQYMAVGQAVVSANSTGNPYVRIIVNGTAETQTYCNHLPSTTDSVIGVTTKILDLEAGDLVTLEFTGDAAYTIDAATGRTFFQLIKIKDARSMLAGEKVFMSARNNSGQAMDNNVIEQVGSYTINEDSHGALDASTGTYTVPVNGVYNIYAKMVSAGVTGWEIAESWQIFIYVNNSLISRALVGTFTDDGSTTSLQHSVPVEANAWPLIAGDTVDIRVFHNNDAATVALSTDIAQNYFSIEKV